MSDAYQEVLASYHRCRASDAFFDTFYRLFLSKSDEVPPKFAHTDFRRQKRMLRQSLLTMLTLRQGIPAAREEVLALGYRHSREQMDVPPRLYECWLDALCEAVAAHDPEYRTELDGMWREVMREGIELMIAQY